MRSKNKDLKTLIKFSSTDLEVWTKDRSKDEHYSILPMENIEEVTDIPKFNRKLVWKKQLDKPARSKPVQSAGRIVLPSMRQNDQSTRNNDTPSGSGTPAKRQKKNNQTDMELDENQEESI